MSSTKNVFRLAKHYDLLKAGCITYQGAVQKELYLWGGVYDGSHGLNNNVAYSSPIQLPGTNWCTTNLGEGGTFLTKGDNTLWVTGCNFFGQLGLNNRIYRSSPVQIPGSWCITKCKFSNYRASVAIKTDGTLWGWGYNRTDRRTAVADTVAQCISSPVQIPGTSWNSVSVSSLVALLLKTDNTLWASGSNGCGNLGQNNVVQYSSPIQIPGTTWCSVSASSSIQSALKSDNTWWTWGFGTPYGTGVNNNLQYSSPVQIPGTSWVEISMSNAPIGRKSDGTIWQFGANFYYGNLGQGVSNNINCCNASSPVQIPGTWTCISSKSYYTLAKKSDNTLWYWGAGFSGISGNNVNTAHRSSPTQVAGTSTWNDYITATSGGVIHAIKCSNL